MDWRILIAITVLSWGGYNVLLKGVGERIAWQSSMLLFVISYALAVGLYCAWQGRLTGADFTEKKAFLPLLAGVLCAVGAVAFFRAIPKAPGSLLMPLVGLYPVVAALGCIVFFKEPVSLRVVLGILCAAAAAFLLGR
jgi:bacterial/archaeal transporter family protein